LSATEFEDPIVTVLRLIESRIRVVRDDGSLASIVCSQEHPDRELLKNYDAAITVGQASPCTEQKHTVNGKLRRRIYTLKATVTTFDRSAKGSDAGKVMRKKTLEQILAIIRENRNQPYTTYYNFYPLGALSNNHKAYDVAAAGELAPSDASWANLSDAEYSNLWGSDELRHSKSTSVNGQYLLMLFAFKIGVKAGEQRNEPRKQCLSRVMLAFEGYGIAPTGNGVTLKVWDNSAKAWSNPQTGLAATDENIAFTLTQNLTDYVDSNGYLYLLARTTNPSNGVSPAVLNCDFAQATVTVKGVTFCDIRSHQDIDAVDVKPFLFKEEIIIVAWLFESIAFS
jgi:hypothetical protein